MRFSRRDFLRSAAAVPFVTIGDWRAQAAGAQAATADPWDRAAAILGRIVAPRFPSRDFEITKWGAVGDGAADCTDAIRNAIAACRAAGGGRVVVPDGRFLTGAIHLQSGVELHLSPGATLAFDHDARKYLPVVLTRWEGTELMNYSAFIYAFEASNVAVTGTGTLDGQADADHWWNWRGAVPAAQSRQAAARDRLLDYGARGVPVARARVRRRAVAAPELPPALSLPQRADRGRHDRQLADVGDPPGALPQRDGPQRHHPQPRAEQRRLRPGVLLATC